MNDPIQDIDRIRDALQFVDAGDRETWLRMGMAIKSELADAGFALWETWSLQAESFNAKDARDVWKSLRAGGKVTLATLFYEARANGWRDDGARQKPTPEELAERRRIAAERAAKEEAEIARERVDTAKKAKAVLKAAIPVPADHPYLARKQVLPVATLREIDASAAAAILGYPSKSGGDLLTGRLLVVPVKQDSNLSTLELIDESGRKAALAGRGSKAGGYWASERLPEGDGNGLTLLIGEGVATVLSAREATGHPAIASLSAGNLSAAAKILRERYPAAALVILADLVKATGEPDPHAIEAARVVGGRLAVPDFGPDRPEAMKDFNDLFQARGRGAIKEIIEKALAGTGKMVVGQVDPPPESPLSGQEDTLGVPSPLPKLPDVPDFPLEILPDGLRPLVADAANRIRFPAEFAAVSSLVALGSVIGRKLGIRLKQRDDWTEYANVWGGLVGQPSTLKSPSMREALRPFKALQEAANARYRDELAEYETLSEAFSLRRNARKKAACKALEENPDAAIDLSVDAPVKPIPRAYWTSDATAERLGELLAENPNGLLVERDELSSLLIKLEDESQATARGLYLSGWSGNEGYRFDRIGRGMTVIPKFALSVLGGIQPGPLSRYVRGAFSGQTADGMLQRFQLMVWPDAGAFEYVDHYPDKEAKEKARAVFQYANDFDPETLGGHDTFSSDQPPFIHLSDAAQGLFREWFEDFMREHRDTEAQSENSPLAAHFGKYPGLVGKLALIVHVADNPGGREVSEDALLKALGWIQYLMPHARRVYHAVEHPETGAAELLLSRLKRGELPSAFTARDIYRKCWHGLSERDSVRRTCQLLFDYGWLIELRPKGDTGGRPSDTVYAVSPLAGGSAP